MRKWKCKIRLLYIGEDGNLHRESCIGGHAGYLCNTAGYPIFNLGGVMMFSATSFDIKEDHLLVYSYERMGGLSDIRLSLAKIEEIMEKRIPNSARFIRDEL